MNVTDSPHGPGTPQRHRQPPRRRCYSNSDMVSLLIWFAQGEMILTPAQRAELVGKLVTPQQKRVNA